MYGMATATRSNRSLSLDKTLLAEIERSKGTASTSERVNELIKTGLEVERVRHLHEEAAAFFSSGSEEDEASRTAFRSASLKSLARDE